MHFRAYALFSCSWMKLLIVDYERCFRYRLHFLKLPWHEQSSTQDVYKRQDYRGYHRGEAPCEPLLFAVGKSCRVNNNAALASAVGNIGNSVHNRQSTVSFKSKKKVRKPESEWFRVENTHDTIIEKEVFYRVQEQIKSRRRQTCSISSNKISFPIVHFCATSGVHVIDTL